MHVMTSLQTRPRVLSGADRAAARALIDRDAVLNCVLDARLLHAPDLDPYRLGGPLWGVDDAASGVLTAALFHGGNLIPLGGDLPALASIAETVARTERGCSSIVGAADAVSAVWAVLSRRWGPARAVRTAQPLLVLDRVPDLEPDPSVRVVRPSELRRFLPASVAMFAEELGVSPLGRDGGAGYRSRVADSIAAGRCLASFDEHGEVRFKAEIGALSRRSAQVQGVWVRPDLRGRGIATSAMVAVLAHTLRLAPSVNLYVNDYNTAGRRLYDRLGMREVGVLSTVLF